MGLKLPVKFDGSTSNIDQQHHDDPKLKKKDYVYVLLKAICTEDDQVQTVIKVIGMICLRLSAHDSADIS